MSIKLNFPTVIVHGHASGFMQNIEAGPHQFKADEPIDAGGTDTRPSPYDLLLAALGQAHSPATTAEYESRQDAQG